MYSYREQFIKRGQYVGVLKAIGLHRIIYVPLDNLCIVNNMCIELGQYIYREKYICRGQYM